MLTPEREAYLRGEAAKGWPPVSDLLSEIDALRARVAALEVYMLPKGYDPRSDEARTAVEYFLDYDVPPDNIRLHDFGDRWAAVASWEEERDADA